MRFLTIIFLCLFTSGLCAQSDWELVKEKKDLKVYVRKLAGSAFKEVKIDGRISCSLSEIVHALEDVESQSEWVESTIEARILETHGTGAFRFYLATDMPYPVKDRDVILNYNRTQNPDTKNVTIKFNSVSDDLSASKDYVRIPELHSSYVLSPSPDGNISIQYLLKVDVGGKMPKWVVNLAITQGPIDTMEALFSAIQSGKYKGGSVAGLSSH